VSSHFTHHDAALRRQHLLRLIAHVSHQECTNELHALVLESTEIKRLWPKYNYSQRDVVQKFALYSFEDSRGFIRLGIDRKKKTIPAICTFNLLTDGLTMLRKMAAQFELSEKLCFLDKTPLTTEDLASLDSPEDYNARVMAALQELHRQLPTFAVMEKGNSRDELLCLLMEKGSFWGMGYINQEFQEAELNILKEQLQPYADNNFIRNSIYSYAESNPSKKRIFAHSS
jgi:DNA polymerase-3 subunit epsilon